MRSEQIAVQEIQKQKTERKQEGKREKKVKKWGVTGKQREKPSGENSGGELVVYYSHCNVPPIREGGDARYRSRTHGVPQRLQQPRHSSYTNSSELPRVPDIHTTITSSRVHLSAVRRPACLYCKEKTEKNCIEKRKCNRYVRTQHHSGENKKTIRQ